MGARVALSDVLLVGEDDAVSVGTPTVDGAQVTAEVADQFRGPKIIVYKYKAKTRYRRKNGHRQSYTRLRIRHILTGGAEEPEEVVAEPVAEEDGRGSRTGPGPGPSTQAPHGTARRGNRGSRRRKLWLRSPSRLLKRLRRWKLWQRSPLPLQKSLRPQKLARQIPKRRNPPRAKRRQSNRSA